MSDARHSHATAATHDIHKSQLLVRRPATIANIFSVLHMFASPSKILFEPGPAVLCSLTNGPYACVTSCLCGPFSTQDLCRKYNIPTAKYEVFNNPEQAKVYIRDQAAPIVVKADGLAAGKGVIVATSSDEACAAVDDMLVNKAFGAAGEASL